MLIHLRISRQPEEEQPPQSPTPQNRNITTQERRPRARSIQATHPNSSLLRKGDEPRTAATAVDHTEFEARAPGCQEPADQNPTPATMATAACDGGRATTTTTGAVMVTLGTASAEISNDVAAGSENERKSARLRIREGCRW
ncbi:hypothetical protein AAHA92_05028 [Salvia divinorum]|uniref:Uncharacterized protein n=1 Tax=Salvia divinorum TaxID=28513 RepID=A0ABD1I236_SALDI